MAGSPWPSRVRRRAVELYGGERLSIAGVVEAIEREEGRRPGGTTVRLWLASAGVLRGANDVRGGRDLRAAHRRVLGLYREGYGQRHVAKRLRISPRTVRQLVPAAERRGLAEGRRACCYAPEEARRRLRTARLIVGLRRSGAAYREIQVRLRVGAETVASALRAAGLLRRSAA